MKKKNELGILETFYKCAGLDGILALFTGIAFVFIVVNINLGIIMILYGSLRFFITFEIRDIEYNLYTELSNEIKKLKGGKRI